MPNISKFVLPYLLWCQQIFFLLMHFFLKIQRSSFSSIFYTYILLYIKKAAFKLPINICSYYWCIEYDICVKKMQPTCKTFIHTSEHPFIKISILNSQSKSTINNHCVKNKLFWGQLYNNCNRNIFLKKLRLI